MSFIPQHHYNAPSGASSPPALNPKLHSIKPHQLFQHLRKNSNQNQWQQQPLIPTEQIQMSLGPTPQAKHSQHTAAAVDELYKTLGGRDSKESSFAEQSHDRTIGANSSSSVYGSMAPPRSLPNATQSPNLIYKHYLPSSRDFRNVLSKSKDSGPPNLAPDRSQTHLPLSDADNTPIQSQKTDDASGKHGLKEFRTQSSHADASYSTSQNAHTNEGSSENAIQFKNTSYFSSQSITGNQPIGSQFKLPQIKNAKDEASAAGIPSPNRRSQQLLDSQSNADTERKQNFVTQSAKQSKAVTDQILTDLDQISVKKAISSVKRSPGEEMVFRNAKIMLSSGQTATVNPQQLIQQQQFMILLNGNGASNSLQVQGCKHDILLQEGKKKPTGLEKPRVPNHKAHSLNNSTVEESTTERNNQALLDLLAAPMTRRQPQSHLRKLELYSQSLQKSTIKKGPESVRRASEAQRHLETPNDNHLVQVSTLSMPPNQHSHFPNRNQERPNANKLAAIQQPPYILKDERSLVKQSSSTSRIINAANSESSFIAASSADDQANLSSITVGGSNMMPAKVPNPYDAQIQQKQSNAAQVQEFLSPKLLYKKKRRDYFQSQTKNPTTATPLLPIPTAQLQNQIGLATGKQSRIDSPRARHSNATLNNVINQLIAQNSSSQTSFVQAIKNINATLGSGPPILAVDAFEALTRAAIGSEQKQASHPLGKSVSQEALDALEPSHINLQRLGSLKNPRQSGQISGIENDQNNIPIQNADIHFQREGRQTSDQNPLYLANLNAKNNSAVKQATGRILTASELYELAKQIKYKQHYAIQARRLHQSPAMNFNVASIGDRRSPRDTHFEGNLQEAINVIKLKEKKMTAAERAAGSSSAQKVYSEVSPQKLSNFAVTTLSGSGGVHDQSASKNCQYKLDTNYSQTSPGSKLTGPNKDHLSFIIRYANRNHEIHQCYEEIAIQREANSQLEPHSSRNTHYNHTTQAGKKRLQVLQEQLQTLDNRLELESLGLQTPRDPIQMVAPSTSTKKAYVKGIDINGHQIFNHYINNQVFQQSAALPLNLNPQQQRILISQLNQQIQQQFQQYQASKDEDGGESTFQFVFPQEYASLQPLALGQPMKMITEAEELAQDNGAAQGLHNPIVLRSRMPRKNHKQQQLSKITKIADLEKLLYSQPGFEDKDGPVLNQNPGGGGRVTNRQGQPDKAYAPKRLEPQVTDNENAQFADHVVNKTIKMMTIMNALMFKVNMSKGDFNAVHTELLTRCARFFSIQVPKQFKNDLPGLMKQKDFLSLAKEKMATLFNAHINKTNNVSEQLISINQGQGQYKYFIGGGNNHMLVKTVFKQRNWWIVNERETFDECNFVWTQWLKERHIRSLPRYGAEEGSSVANGQDPQEQETLNQLPPTIRMYNKMHDNQCLSDKKHLFFNMRDLYLSEGKDPFSVMPLTFVIDDGLNDIEWDHFETKFNQIQEAIQSKKQQMTRQTSEVDKDCNEEVKLPESQEDAQPTILAISEPATIAPHHTAQAVVQSQSNIWIIKPGENTNRGCGIIVSRDFQEIKQIVRDKSSRQDKTAILQKYIENPLLINRRKFDIRCYGLLTSINGQMLGFFYQDGYLRTSCKEFNCQNLSNRYIHLTNDAVQKNHEDYGKFENANKLSFSDFDKYFAEFPIGDYELRFQRDFLPQIRALVRDSFRAVESKIDPERKTNTFEIFGYDFMIDDDLKIKLIEVNTNPCLEVCCPLLARIIPSMLDSVFRVALDPIFQQPPSRRVFSGTEVVNDLKMELVFESKPPSTKKK